VTLWESSVALPSGDGLLGKMHCIITVALNE
jgi:hypothetical protein